MRPPDYLLKTLEVEEGRSRRFAEYWLSLPKIDLIPRRDAFRPEQVPDLIANVIIHELVSPELLLLRLVGSAVVEEYGRELRGRNYLDFVDEARRASASRAIHLVCEHPAGMVVRVRSQTRDGRIIIRETIAFPMRGGDGAARFAYFCSSTIPIPASATLDESGMQVLGVLQRTYLDIGAGVPDFQD